MSVAEKICQSQLHAQLRKVVQGSSFLDSDQAQVLKCHQTLEGLLVESGAKGASELAAAYLHVHRKDSFPLVSGPARMGARLFFESKGKDPFGLARVARPGGYGAWIEACRAIAHYLGSSSQHGGVCLLQLNEFLEDQARVEIE